MSTSGVLQMSFVKYHLFCICDGGLIFTFILFFGMCLVVLLGIMCLCLAKSILLGAAFACVSSVSTIGQHVSTVTT